MTITYEWCGDVPDGELFELTVAHGGRPSAGWWEKIRSHSFGWTTARDGGGALIGFVNVAWDGSDHAFLLDPKVRPTQAGLMDLTDPGDVPAPKG